MQGTEAIRVIMGLIGGETVINANGFIGREVFNAKDRPGNFYMIGSMGLASSIGLGIAVCRPEKKVVILDGDGNVLMAMGTLAMIAALAPANLVHVALDNEVYESTGKQKTLSAAVSLAAVAKGAGYKYVETVSETGGLERALRHALQNPGPSFLLVKVKPGFKEGTGRVTHSPEEIKQRLMSTLRE